MEEFKVQKQQSRRDEFFERLKVEVEGLYGGEENPSIEFVEREKIVQSFKKQIEDYCRKNNIKKDEAIQIALDKLNERRKINPGSKKQYDLIEDSLYDILYEGQDFDDGEIDL